MRAVTGCHCGWSALIGCLLLVFGGSGVSAGEPGPAAPDGPLTFQELVDIALANNPDLRAATERIAIAQARVGEATSAFYPDIGARLRYGLTNNPAEAFGMVIAQRRFTFDADFNHPGATQDVRPELRGMIPLFRGGQDYERRAAAALGVDAARLERAAVHNALVNAVAGSYYALLAAPEQVEAARASIQAVDSALTQTRARVAAGAALKSDTLSLEVREAEAREALVRAQNAVELARTGLRVVLGLDGTAPLEVVAHPGDTPAPIPEFENAMQDARTGRPELRAASRLVEIREHELKAEQAAYWPRVDAVGTVGQNNPNFAMSGSRENWTVGAVAEVDLFSGFRTRERIRAAERSLAEAREGERKARLEVEREVRTALLMYQEARERARVATAATGAADEALRLVQEQYDAGAVTITRYLETEGARTAARTRAIAARFDERRAGAALETATGAWVRKETAP